MRLKFVVEVEVERISGKFAGKDEVAAEIEQWLSDADYGFGGMTRTGCGW